MRIKFLGLAIAAIATFGTASAWGGDREIAEQIIQRLKQNRQTGVLRDFTLDMKVDQGVVLFRGKVHEAAQKKVVLRAADGIEGVVNVVDEVKVQATAKPVAAKTAGDFSLRDALQAEANTMMIEETQPMSETANQGAVRPAAAVELAAPGASGDQQIVSSVVSALGRAQRSGRLKGFGVDVKCSGGAVTLSGRAASDTQRNQIVRIAESVAGVSRINNSIAIPSPAAPVVAAAPLRDKGPVLRPVSAPMPAHQASAPQAVPVQNVPYRSQGMHMMAQPTGASLGSPVMGAPMMGAPVGGHPMPIGAHGVGAPIHESPNLPNYAWPGYSAYPNYAALTYPQQYSPSAWPYIGPFYPYPQVPLGWRRVTLEWKDGWWNLDFTDRYR